MEFDAYKLITEFDELKARLNDYIDRTLTMIDTLKAEIELGKAKYNNLSDSVKQLQIRLDRRDVGERELKKVNKNV